jgi:hypothetical protein
VALPMQPLLSFSQKRLFQTFNLGLLKNKTSKNAYALLRVNRPALIKPMCSLFVSLVGLNFNPPPP